MRLQIHSTHFNYVCPLYMRLQTYQNQQCLLSIHEDPNTYPLQLCSFYMRLQTYPPQLSLLTIHEAPNILIQFFLLSIHQISNIPTVNMSTLYTLGSKQILTLTLSAHYAHTHSNYAWSLYMRLQTHKQSNYVFSVYTRLQAYPFQLSSLYTSKHIPTTIMPACYIPKTYANFVWLRYMRLQTYPLQLCLLALHAAPHTYQLQLSAFYTRGLKTYPLQLSLWYLYMMLQKHNP